MSADRICATCREPLAQRGSETVCVRCLASFLAGPDEPTAEEVQTGKSASAKPRRYGHFEILADAAGAPLELGRGSMGTTYRARDTVLHRVVALKVIEQSVAALPAARDRFLREARAAAQFQHPSVAAVSYYGEQDGECYYVMELVEGETLEARVRREGPLTAAATLEIALQITRALVAAEALGVIHRDLKPANLMLLAPARVGASGDGAPLVKVIDFGLAKAVNAAAQAAGPSDTRGGFVGTPAFASPEQFGLVTDFRIDHRADIYSLGATMWYALCGRAPFAGRSLGEIYAQQSEPLPTGQLTSRGVPRTLILLLESTLAVNPADRPQSARELVERLQGCRDQVLRQSQPKEPRRLFRRLILAAGVGALMLAAGAWWWHQKALERSSARSIAVLSFENQSPNPDDAFYATGMQDEITANLARVGAIKVISPDSANQYPPGKRDFARIGAELGVRYLLTGSVRHADNQVQVKIQMIDVIDPTHPWVREYRRDAPEIFILQSEIVRAVTDRLRTSLSAEEKAAIDLPPTTDPVAYDLYLQAQNNLTLSVGTEQSRAMYGRSQALLEKAIQQDPKFVLAYCLLAYVHDELATLKLDGTPEELAVDHRALAESALQMARQLRPDAGEVHLGIAFHLARIVRDFAQAKIEADLARKTLPNSADVESIAGRVAENTAQWEDSTRARERAVALDPRDPGNYAYLEQNFRMRRQYGAADRVLQKLIAMMPAEDALPFQVERATEILEARADLAPLRAALTNPPGGEGPAEVNIFRFMLAYFDGDTDGLARAIAAAPQKQFHLYLFIYPKAWFEGLKERLRGNRRGEVAAFTEARAEVEELLRADPTSQNAGAMSLLGLIDAALGNREAAVREEMRACEWMPESSGATETGCLHNNLAVVYAWTGQPDRAIAELKTWIEKPAGASMVYQPSYGDLKLNPMWDPLRRDPRFTALVQRLAPAK